jgi:hypothetical protein
MQPMRQPLRSFSKTLDDPLLTPFSKDNGTVQPPTASLSYTISTTATIQPLEGYL